MTFALSEPVLLVLLSLAEQPRHGYSILKDVESMSDGRVLLSTGTLYGALQRLLERIAPRWRADKRTAGVLGAATALSGVGTGRAVTSVRASCSTSRTR